MESTYGKVLSELELAALEQQNSRLVSDYKAKQLEMHAKKHWDLFYKRNEARFFRDRHWTTREFADLLNEDSCTDCKVLLEVGCGVGNLLYPLVEERINFFIYACDLSNKAIDLVISNELYDSKKIDAFQSDITTCHIFGKIASNSVDIITMIFVLSAIHPDKFANVFENAHKLLKPGGCLLFRDYGLFDMAQIRFKAGNKIAENFYMRQDGTRSYFFTTEVVAKLALDAGFGITSNTYIQRRTINVKENIDVARLFVQGKFIK